MNNNLNDIFWMYHAIMLADKAEKNNEIPIGAVLVLNNKIIGEGWNCSINNNDPTAHAEIIALRQGAKQTKNYRLLNTIMYVTIEPCIMCIGAMLHARIKKVIFGAKNKKSMLLNFFSYFLYIYNSNHKILITSSIMGNLCADKLNNFFYHKRNKNKKK